jgi:hypothetical protein
MSRIFSFKAFTLRVIFLSVRSIVSLHPGYEDGWDTLIYMGGIWLASGGLFGLAQGIALPLGLQDMDYVSEVGEPPSRETII